MDPQHFMLCSSWVVAERQSANCRLTRATAAKNTNSLLLVTLI
jgi:hypothetical protein